MAREAALNVREAVAAGLRLAEKIPISVDEEMDKEIERFSNFPSAFWLYKKVEFF